MFIDANGDAEGNYTVLGYIDDVDANGTIRRVIVPIGDFKQASSAGSQGDGIPVCHRDARRIIILVEPSIFKGFIVYIAVANLFHVDLCRNSASPGRYNG